MSSLRLSTDRKTTAAAFEARADKLVPRIPNAFAIVPGPTGEGGSCPGATSWCRDHCYAIRGMGMAYPGPRAVRETNYRLLRQARTTDRMVALLEPMIAEFVALHERWSPNEPARFRIHSDGDFYSPAYARAWCETARRFPAVAFWTYTRSTGGGVLKALAEHRPPNLALYVSVDPTNRARAVRAARHYGLPTAAVDIPGVEVATPGMRTLQCPATDGRLELATRERGGACNRCTYCVVPRGNVTFVRH